MTAKIGMKKGKWSVSPLREAATLLGVLHQQGLRGKGLIQGFEKWAPKIVGYPRSDMEALYERQTGRPLTDYILLQKADKVVRNGELGPEAEVLNQSLAKLRL